MGEQVPRQGMAGVSLDIVSTPAHTVGIALRIGTAAAWKRFVGSSGLHFRGADQTAGCVEFMNMTCGGVGVGPRCLEGGIRRYRAGSPPREEMRLIESRASCSTASGVYMAFLVLWLAMQTRRLAKAALSERDQRQSGLWKGYTVILTRVRAI